MSIKQKQLFIVLAICVSTLFLAMANSPQIADLAYQLKLKTMEVLQLRETISDLRLQVANYQIRDRETVFVETVMSFYQFYCGKTFPSKYSADLQHIRKVRRLILKYEYINKDTKSNININNFIFSWCHNETGLNPECINYNKDGTTDRYITQINSKTEPSLIKIWSSHCKEDINVIKLDKVEYGLVLIRIWICERERMGWSWQYLGTEPSRGWSMFWWLRNV